MRSRLGCIVLIVVLGGSSCGKRDGQSARRDDCEAITAAIVVPFPGADPVTVEQAVVLPIEQAVRTLDGVAQVRSLAREGQAEVVIELDRDARRDPERVLAAIATAIDRVDHFPAEVDRPVISLSRPATETALLVVYGDQSMTTLDEIANQLRDRLIHDPSVGRVEMLGLPDRELAIDVDPARLRAYGLTLSQVAAALRSESINVDLANSVVHVRPDGVPVRASDIAGSRRRTINLYHPDPELARSAPATIRRVSYRRVVPVAGFTWWTQTARTRAPRRRSSRAYSSCPFRDSLAPSGHWRRRKRELDSTCFDSRAIVVGCAQLPFALPRRECS